MSEYYEVSDDNDSEVAAYMRDMDSQKYETDQSANKIFKLDKQILSLMFDKKNVSMPVNEGEIKTSLNILKDMGYNKGLCQHLATSKENGIVGDELDILRRQAVFGKQKIAMPKIEGFV